MSRYQDVLVELFRRRYRRGVVELAFTVEEIQEAAVALHGRRLGNAADVVYSLRNRIDPPPEIAAHGHWVAASSGRRGVYVLRRINRAPRIPIPAQADLAPIEVPDATPEIVQRYAGSDEQGVLARIRYNRLLDLFLEKVAYHLQGHFRTAVLEGSQIEIDELYVGVDKQGDWYIIPVEAKGAREPEEISLYQLENMVIFAGERYPELQAVPVVAKQMPDRSIVLLRMTAERDFERMAICDCRRYRLVQVEEAQQ